MLPTRFTVGAWTAEPRASQLVRGTEVVRLEPKVMAVLVALAERAGEVVTRDEMLAHAWDDVLVTDSSLTRAVSEIRKALGDDSRAPRYVETIPTVGYRLVADVSPVGDPALPLDMPSGDGVALPVLTASSSPSPRAPAAAHAPVDSGSVLGPRSGTDRRVVFGVGAAVIMAALTVFGLGRAPAPSPTAESGEPFDVRVLTTLRGTEQHSALSPDGSRLAFVWADGTGASELYVQETNASAPHRLTQTVADEQHPVWDPEGRSLAFLRGDSSGAYSIYTISAYGSDERLVASGLADPGGLAWSPDGRALAYVARADGGRPSGIWVLDLATGARRVLTRPPASRTDEDPRFSPDGQHVSFLRRINPLIGDLYQVAVSGGVPERLTHDSARIPRHAWMPDGASLLISSDRSGLFGLWAVSLSGAAPRRVPVPVSDPGGFSIASDGLLAVEDYLFDTNLWAQRGDAEAGPVVSSSRWDEQPALSPDGSKLAFVSTRSGYTELWLRDGEAPPVRLTHFDSGAVGAPDWSPNGEEIAFHAYEGDRAALYVLAPGGQPQRIVSGSFQALHPRWSRDGRVVYYGSDRDGAWAIWKVTVATGASSRVSGADGVMAEEEPEGRGLYVADYSGRLYLLEQDGADGVALRSGRAALPKLHPLDWANWTVVDDGLLYVHRASEGGVFHRQVRRWDERRSHIVVEEIGGLDYLQPALTASADGRLVVWAQVDALENEVLLVGDPSAEASFWTAHRP